MEVHSKRNHVKGMIRDCIEDGIDYELSLFDEENPNIFCIRFEGEYDRMDITGFVGDIVVNIMNTQEYEIHEEDYHHNTLVIELLKSTIEEWELVG